jgi:cytoskeletal protein RodZ
MTRTSTPPPDREAAMALAQNRLSERRQRVRKIRRRSAAAAGATFAVSWGIVFGQLASGDDPALAGQAKTVAASSSGSSGTTKTTTKATTSSSGTASSTPAASSTTTTTPSAPSAVTTSQS